VAVPATGEVFPHGPIIDPINSSAGKGLGDGIAPMGEDPVRPVGMAISPVDGALYVSSDNASVLGGQESIEQGAIYRIGLDRSARLLTSHDAHRSSRRYRC